jgi:hypothetical protein
MKIDPIQLFGGGVIVFALTSVLSWFIFGGMRLGFPFAYDQSYLFIPEYDGGSTFNTLNLVLDFVIGVCVAFGYFAFRGDKA